MASEASPSIPIRQRLTVRLTAGVIVALLLVGIPFLLAFHRLRQAEQLEAMAEANDDLGRILVGSLRSAMLGEQPHHLDETIRKLATSPEIVRSAILDDMGEVRVSSDLSLEGKVFEKEEALCQECHGMGDAPPDSRTIVLQQEGPRVFRVLTVIPNESRCYECHEPARRKTGLLMVDHSVRAASYGFFAGMQNTVLLGSVMAALTIAVLVLLLHRMVHQPLQAMAATSRRIAGGELEARVPIKTTGEFAVLGAQLNRMTEHLAASIQAEGAHRRELESILDSVGDEIVVLDEDLRVLASNLAFRASSGEVVVNGMACGAASAPGWPCSERPEGCAVSKVFRTGKLEKDIVSFVMPDGRERTIEIHASPIQGSDGEVHQVVEARRDISERRQMEATLAHSERLSSLGLLASGLSHEINNPLGAIATSVEGLRRRLVAGEEEISAEVASAIREKLPLISKEVERARVITDRLMNAARPPGHTRNLVDVNQAVEDTLAIRSYDVKRAGIVVEKKLQENLPPLVEDGSLVVQIVMNLALNAIQAMANGGGILRVATATDNDEILIEVADTGGGIPREILGRIYEPFFTTKPLGKGTGLGLFITHRIVSELGGSIHVVSEPGPGTRFKIHLPRHGSTRVS